MLACRNLREVATSGRSQVLADRKRWEVARSDKDQSLIGRVLIARALIGRKF